MKYKIAYFKSSISIAYTQFNIGKSPFQISKFISTNFCYLFNIVQNLESFPHSPLDVAVLLHLLCLLSLKRPLFDRRRNSDESKVE